MTPAQFRAWREAMLMTQLDAARALGISERSIRNYEADQPGRHGKAEPLPRHIALACAAITAGLAPWGDQLLR